jgi:hypothetical protein
MAAMLTKEGALASAVAEACEAAPGDVADFLNACAEIGVLESRAVKAGAPADAKATTMDIWRGVVGTFKRGEPG